MLISLSCLTCASTSISLVSWLTGTPEAAHGVNAAGISAASSVVYCTLVDICVITNEIRQNPLWYDLYNVQRKQDGGR